MRALLRLAYDGTHFSGCGPLPGQRTVAGEVITALGRVDLTPLLAELLSRTDSGVHAEQNVGHVVLPRPMASDALLKVLDRHLPTDLRCNGVAPIEALPEVRAKTYVYSLDISRWGRPECARTHWRVRSDVDLGLLERAAELLIGRRDFAAFYREGETRSDLVRSIEFVGWKQHGETLQCSVRGPRFTYKLVRSLVGGMVAVGLGTHPIEELEDALAGRPLAVARHTAPAHGLSLRSVDVDVEWVSA